MSTIFVVLVLGLVLRAAIIRMPSALSSKQSQQKADLALTAAQSGLDYAVYRFRADPSWEGGEMSEVVLDREGLRVTEKEGLVTGEIRTEGGPELYFRFRFQPVEDPAQLVSVNNLGSDVPVPLPNSSGTFEVPSHSVCLFVEGGVGEVDENGQIPPGGKVVEAVYRLMPDGGVQDAVLMAAGDLSLDVADSDGQVYLSGTYLDRADGDALRLRSKKEIRVSAGGGGVGNLILATRTEAELSQSLGVVANYDSSKVTLVEESPSDGKDFYNLTWDQIPKASGKKSSRDSIQIPGGVYVYSGSSESQRELRYYDMSYRKYLQDAKQLAQDPDSGVLLLSPGLEEIRKNKNLEKNSSGFSFGPGMVSYLPNGAKRPSKYPGFRFNLKRNNLYVVPSEKGREDLVIIPLSPQKLDKGDKTDYPNLPSQFGPDHFSMVLSDSTLTVPGDVIIQGGVNGKGGTIISEGDITILAGKTLELASEGRSEAEMDRELEAQMGLVEQLASGVEAPVDTLASASLQLNLYSKGDLNLSTYVQRADSYRSLTFRGLLYSWGRISVWAGKGPKAKRGTLTLQGAAVAYGNDPVTGDPGGGSDGDIDVRAKHINLAWDPRYLPSLSELQPDNKSTFALRQSRLRQVR